MSTFSELFGYSGKLKRARFWVLYIVVVGLLSLIAYLLGEYWETESKADVIVTSIVQCVRTLVIGALLFKRLRDTFLYPLSFLAIIMVVLLLIVQIMKWQLIDMNLFEAVRYLQENREVMKTLSLTASIINIVLLILCFFPSRKEAAQQQEHVDALEESPKEAEAPCLPEAKPQTAAPVVETPVPVEPETATDGEQRKSHGKTLGKC